MATSQPNYNPLYTRATIHELQGFIHARIGKLLPMRNGKKALRQVLGKLDHEQTFPLPALPSDIRLMIYEQILHPEVASQSYVRGGKVVHRPRELPVIRNTAIFRVSKQVSREARHYWYQQKTFQVHMITRYYFADTSSGHKQLTECFSEAVKGLVVCSYETRSRGCRTALGHFHDSLMGKGPSFGFLHKLRHLSVDLQLKTYGSGASPAARVWANANFMLFCLANAIRRSDTIEDVTFDISRTTPECTDEALKRILFPVALIRRLDRPHPRVIVNGLPEAMHAWMHQHSKDSKLWTKIRDHDKIRAEGYRMVEDVKLLSRTREGRNVAWALRQIDADAFVMAGWAEGITSIMFADREGFEHMDSLTKALRLVLDEMRAAIENPDVESPQLSAGSVVDTIQGRSRGVTLEGDQSTETTRDSKTSLLSGRLGTM
ncbi:hypothetical protein LTR78_008354 [Recurvomyces mirabilis]|uniref:Uncharacterized protein n=1 Tax=Recurvomyces mirabilis TaxID=574656 RepID=A0AAE0TTC1_9PEZI|nr:hypothetical protein LTR78_008354 [Recurvomyces mirabilis]KAK5158519.1 hypothetical protein LTS14_003539 [Recurvomyces mirabilis]